MARRNPGEGSVCQRSNGTWQASLQHRGVRKTIYGKTEREVSRKLHALKRQVATTNNMPTPGRKTVQDLLNEWLATIGPSLRPKTFADYQWCMKRYVSSVLGRIPLSQITPVDLQRLYSSFQEKGHTRTAAKVHARLHSAFKLAVMWGWIADNPTERTLSPKHQYERKEVWSRQELSCFLEAVEGHWLEPLWIALIGTGCRLGELLALQWQDVDLTDQNVSISKTMQRVNQRWIIGEPKTKSGWRTITVPLVVVEAFKRQRVLQLERRLQAGPKWEDGGLVFTGEQGQPVCQRVVQLNIRRVCQRLRIKPMAPHGLRHLHASLLLSRGLPLPLVSRRLGHAHSGITAEVYSHVLSSQDVEAAQAIQGALEVHS